MAPLCGSQVVDIVLVSAVAHPHGQGKEAAVGEVRHRVVFLTSAPGHARVNADIAGMKDVPVVHGEPRQVKPDLGRAAACVRRRARSGHLTWPEDEQRVSVLRSSALLAAAFTDKRTVIHNCGG